MPKLKAYMIREDDEGNCVIAFATNNATARREGAGELNLDFTEVESCRRAPEFDQYAPGPVPPLTLIEHGWWFECYHCHRKVTTDMYDDVYGVFDDEGNDLSDADIGEKFNPVPKGLTGVYCCQECVAREWAEKRAKETIEAAIAEVAYAKFPGATVQSVWERIERFDRQGNVTRWVCAISHPEMKFSFLWPINGEFAEVSQCDQEIFKRLYGREPVSA